MAKVQSNVIERGVDCFILNGNINSSEFKKKMVRAAAKGNVSVFINNAIDPLNVEPSIEGGIIITRLLY